MRDELIQEKADEELYTVYFNLISAMGKWPHTLTILPVVVPGSCLHAVAPNPTKPIGNSSISIDWKNSDQMPDKVLKGGIAASPIMYFEDLPGLKMAEFRSRIYVLMHALISIHVVIITSYIHTY